MNPKKNDILVARALRICAQVMCDSPNLVTTEEGKALDRALRSCSGISDIDRVWVRWSYVAEQFGWLTTKELVRVKGQLWYPPEVYDEQ